MEAVPCDVVRLVHNVMSPVGADAAGEDNDQSEAKESDEGDALRERQLGVVEGRQWKNPQVKVEDGGNGGVSDHRRAFVDTMVRVERGVPVARDRTITGDIDSQQSDTFI